MLKHLLSEIGAFLVRRKTFVAAWIAQVMNLRKLAMTNAAMMSRRLGQRAVVLVGIGATVYAGVLFVADRLAPGAPSASHDAILKSRWAGPKPSKQVVIVDIDERSLAMLAPEHGRWPWPRQVLADGLGRLGDSGVRTVLFNVLLTDPDKSNPDSDGAMEAAAALMPNVAYPIIRLNAKNDSHSQLKVAQLLQRTGDPVGEGGERTVAVLLPIFEPMIARVGVANQQPDDDGIIRRYAVGWSDSVLQMPSIVSRTLTVGGINLQDVPANIALNWRNKADRYTRVSFSDLLAADPKDSKWSMLKDAVVVMGVSAPGLGQVKPTAVSAMEDDNEILATALDDLLSDSHLRVMPAWLVLLLEIGAIWALVWVGTGYQLYAALNKLFVLVQLGAATITMLSASYTYYLIDLSPVMAFGAGIFGVIKLVQSLDGGWSRARPGLRHATSQEIEGGVLLIGYRDSQVNRAQASELQAFLEARVGLPRVIRVDDLFGGESFVRKVCEDYSCQLCLVDAPQREELLGLLSTLSFNDQLDVRDVALTGPWDAESQPFRLSMAPSLLRQCADLLGPVDAPTAATAPA
jgi:adenylate cyclase